MANEILQDYVSFESALVYARSIGIDEAHFRRVALLWRHLAKVAQIDLNEHSEVQGAFRDVRGVEFARGHIIDEARKASRVYHSPGWSIPGFGATSAGFAIHFANSLGAEPPIKPID